MRQLILMRHAKSSWDSPVMDDHQRPLNGRGRRAAQAIGAWLRENNYIPDQILSSSSARTRETCDRLMLTAERTFLDRLYHAGAAEMRRVLQSANSQSVLMLGHNPGIAQFAHDLVDAPPNHPRFSSYPTCATLIATFPIDDWADLQPGTGTVMDFIIPRALTDG